MNQYYSAKRRGVAIVNEKFEGRSLEIHTINGERLVGIVDEVALYELGMSIENTPTIIPRKSILYIITGLSDIHGLGECCEKEHVLDEEFIGSDVYTKLINGNEIEGRLTKVTRDEVGLAQSNKAIIIPRKSILYLKIVRR
ncbi:MAG: hypothetical protein N3D82_03820 [Ignisphaera sp.]|nr:hypothetical protein [Ignisphaera sp.]MCX8168135.1 hypothetical protein [Ignisphaera sp.]MDW8085430.1 hypothetical protein [Ignisphaera sp.]